MQILVLNSGSSSLKYQLFDMDTEDVLVSGAVEKIGAIDSTITHKLPNQKIKRNISILDHSEAIDVVLANLMDENYGVIKDLSAIDAVGHRVVHGGSKFSESVIIDEKVLNTIEDLSDLAPLHNPPSVLGIKACQEKIPDVPMVAVFDTAFHQTMPPSSYMYAISYDMYEKYGIRKYGFHGTSHRYVTGVALELLNKPVEETKIISCHLGNGSSVAAILGGKVIDTSMGFTPLDGLVMGTRCGSIDPAIVPFIMEKENMTPHEISEYMNKKCGMLGISGISHDMRDLEMAAYQGDYRADLALDLVDKSIIKCIGAYAAEMNGVDAILFTAGIGENGLDSCAVVCRSLSFLGLDFCEKSNADRMHITEISKPESRVKAYVIPTNEELTIARDAKELIEGKLK